MIRKKEVGRSAIKADKHLTDLSITTEKLANQCVTSDKIANRTIEVTKLIRNIINTIEEYSLVAGVQEVAADAIGTPAFPHSVNIIKPITIEEMREAEVIIDFVWADTADGTLQVYDETNGVVLAETGNLTGGEADDDLILSKEISDLKSGARIICRGNITTAGATGEVSKIYRCFIKISRGYS